MDIKRMTALETSAIIKKGELSPLDILKDLLNNIKSSKLNSFITVNEEDAFRKAEEIELKIKRGELNSPLAGVPIAIKDNICTRGILTTAASKMLSDFIPPYNATVIDRLEQAGMIVFGKTNMDEFAMGSTSETSYYGAVKNPYDQNRVAGGSSGGSAAAVANGEALVALGSDTGGSVRQPAAFCGLTAFKPTYGLVSRYGLIAYASSLDQIGPIGKNVSDCAAILDIISGVDEKDSTSLNQTGDYLNSLNGNIKGKKIAVINQCFNQHTDGAIKEQIFASLDIFKSMGAEVSFIDIDFLDFVVSSYYIIASAEAASNLSRYDGVKYGYRADSTNGIEELYIKTRSEGFGREVKKRIMLGNFVLSSGYYDAFYLKALKVKGYINHKIDLLFKEYDALLCPTMPTAAPVIGESLKDPLKMYQSDIYTVIANLCGLPAINLPCGFDTLGLPIGLQIIGAPLNDAKILDIGYAYQSATPHHKDVAEVLR